MILVSFTFLGHDAKVEAHGQLWDASLIHKNEFLKKLHSDPNPTIMKNRSERFRKLFQWCKNNSDFCDDIKDRQSNFVFK